ncbi:hypothetical protein [Paraglaciecola sp. MB-3u-78]|uniref:hypothetical protein n=1 Tax=Paraglaciecola sp. MB-3u-78 TaxID=2058332 RepID=UPI000C31C68E|nr:hypothetical protein [Paraglaciecola sp. MB-3u-78]PKG95967.1 hypothetical protein CXF95_25205 [Paraglaciecola sp. MB-3u-78]
MNFKFITLIIVFILSSGLYGIYEFRNDWSNISFFTGLVCGLPLVTCYLGNRHIGFSLFLLGITSLILASFGVFGDIPRDRLFFNGLSLGALFGWIPSYLILKRKTSAVLANCCEQEGYDKLASYFDCKTRE